MAHVNVTISPDGTLSPSYLSLQPQDTVAFEAAADTVLCVAPASVFGSGRYEIPANSTLDLTVQGTSGSFDLLSQTGDLTAQCSGSRAVGREGAGQVGGGPG